MLLNRIYGRVKHDTDFHIEIFGQYPGGGIIKLIRLYGCIMLSTLRRVVLMTNLKVIVLPPPPHTHTHTPIRIRLQFYKTHISL